MIVAASHLVGLLPAVRGAYREGVDLSKITWFQVGGRADILFRPADREDLAFFLAFKPEKVPVTLLGVGSNILIRDGGVEGVVIRLGKGFTDISITEMDGQMVLEAGAGALDINVAQVAAEASMQGLEFLSGIPGTIGGALAMNAGAYGADISEVMMKAEIIDTQGQFRILTREDMGFSYRRNAIPKDWIFTRAWFHVTPGDKSEIAARMMEIARKREESQPIRSRTTGSTFTNPAGDKKAWQLIDAAGCRGLTRGGAQMSEKHCNFMINNGEATAEDLEALGEEVRQRVKETSGIMLEWEVQRIGRRL